MSLIAGALARLRGAFPLEQKSGPAPSPDWGLDAWVSSPTLSGATVTPDTAMRVPAVAASVNIIAGALGSLPAKVYRRTDDGAKLPDPSHAAHALVHRRASPHLSAARLREQLTRDALLHGNAYAFAVRVNGQVAELVRLDPRSIQLAPDDTGAPRFITTDASRRELDPADVLHIPAPHSADGLGGVSPIALNREAIALAIALEAHAARLFGRGARPSGLLSFTGKLSNEIRPIMRESWNRAHGGENSGGTAILEEGATWQPLSFTSVDNEFNAQRTAQAYEVARAFGCPPSLIGLVDRATWANSEAERRAFLSFTLSPWLGRWRAELERVLLGEDDADHLIDFETAAFLAPDTEARARTFATYRSAGVMTANEVRARENMPARPDGDSLASPFTTSGTPAPTEEVAS